MIFIQTQCIKWTNWGLYRWLYQHPESRSYGAGDKINNVLHKWDKWPELPSAKHSQQTFSITRKCRPLPVYLLFAIIKKAPRQLLIHKRAHVLITGFGQASSNWVIEFVYWKKTQLVISSFRLDYWIAARYKFSVKLCYLHNAPNLKVLMKMQHFQDWCTNTHTRPLSL